jgi:hypothetical protein
MDVLKEDKIYKEAKEYWNKYKDVLMYIYGVKNMDEYLQIVLLNHKTAYSIPDEEKKKYYESQMLMVGKKYREVVKVIGSKKGKR